MHNTGKNFLSTKFQQHAKSLAIKVREVLVKAYNSISKVERYYTLLRRLYEILQDKLQDKKLDKEIILQIAIKAINNITRPDKLVLTLLVFRLYLKITDQDPPAPTITKRAKAIYIAIKEVRRFYAERQV